MGLTNTPSLATLLILCIPFVISNGQGDGGLGQSSQYYPNMNQLNSNLDELGPDSSSEESELSDGYNPPSLDDILNTRVNDVSQLCSRRLVALFFVTGDLQQLRNCRRIVEVFGNGSDSQTAGRSRSVTTTDEQPDNSYSGRLLKRILQNMGTGTTRIDVAAAVRDRINEQEAEKRSRLSINGPLGSLVDMLRHESRRHRRPQYAFHQQLLKLG